MKSHREHQFATKPSVLANSPNRPFARATKDVRLDSFSLSRAVNQHRQDPKQEERGMTSWRIKLLIFQGRAATRSKIFPKNEISIVPDELASIKVFLLISLEFL